MAPYSPPQRWTRRVRRRWGNWGNVWDCLSDGEGEIGNLGQDFGQIPNEIWDQNLSQISGQILSQKLGLNSGQNLIQILGEDHVKILDNGGGKERFPP